MRQAENDAYCDDDRRAAHDLPWLSLWVNFAELHKHMAIIAHTQDIDFSDPQELEYIKNIPPMGANTSRLLERSLIGPTEVTNFEESLKLHQLLDRVARAANFPPS